jgi:hypothetical protein
MRCTKTFVACCAGAKVVLAIAPKTEKRPAKHPALSENNTRCVIAGLETQFTFMTSCSTVWNPKLVPLVPTD